MITVIELNTIEELSTLLYENKQDKKQEDLEVPVSIEDCRMKVIHWLQV